jgi:uncharacterized protein YrzB (UPF0473 family)
MKINNKNNKNRKKILDILLDESNTDPIVLVDTDGKKLAFEQVAVIPYDQKIYCILKPIDEIKDVEDDEAIVFYVDEGNSEDPVLMVETDEMKAIDVFEEYYDMLEKDK